MLSGVEEADRAHNAVAGLDQVITVEARKLTQAGEEGVLGALDEVAGTGLVDRLVASNGGMHDDAPNFLCR